MKVCNGIWKKILVWNGIWNGRFLVWNGRKLPVWNMEKSSSIPFHTMPCSREIRTTSTGSYVARSTTNPAAAKQLESRDAQRWTLDSAVSSF